MCKISKPSAPLNFMSAATDGSSTLPFSLSDFDDWLLKSSDPNAELLSFGAPAPEYCFDLNPVSPQDIFSSASPCSSTTPETIASAESVFKFDSLNTSSSPLDMTFIAAAQQLPTPVSTLSMPSPTDTISTTKVAESAKTSVQKKRKSPMPSVPKEQPLDIPQDLRVKRQKQNEAAKRCREKRMANLQEAQDRAAVLEKEKFELTVRLRLLEEEKVQWHKEEFQLKMRIEELLRK